MFQRRSATQLLVHVVWATRLREPTVAPDDDAWLASVLHGVARDNEIDLITCGNASDHVHVVMRLLPTVAPSTAVGLLKGASSHTWNHRPVPSSRLEWQDGFWAESLSPSGLDGLTRYVTRQRVHHAHVRVGEPWEAWFATL